MIDVAADRARGGRPARADVRPRRPADAAAGREHGLLVRRRRRAPSATRRSTSRCSCNRGIYHKGWTAVTRHSTPWVIDASCRPSTTTSGSCTRPTTGRRPTTSPPSSPSKLRELQRLFLIEAAKYNVLPLDDRRVERFNADLAGRPQLDPRQLAAAVRRHGPADARTRSSCIKNKSHAVTAQVVVPDGGRRRRDHRPGRRVRRLEPLRCTRAGPAYCYNLFGLQRFKVYGEHADPGRRAPGADGVRLRRRRPRQGRRRHPLRRRRARSARAASRRP